MLLQWKTSTLSQWQKPRSLHGVPSFELNPELRLSHSNLLPNQEELSIVKKQLEEDQHDLTVVDARIELATAEIEEKSKALEKLKAELDEMLPKHAKTAQRLSTESTVARSFAELALEQAFAISRSELATELRKIHSDYKEKSRALVTATVQTLRQMELQESEIISRLQSSSKHEYACLGLLSDRKAFLIASRDQLISSMAYKHALIGWTRRLPTETLQHIFTTALDSFIHERIHDPDSNTRHPIIDISHVCHRWRTIAIDTTELWRYIHIERPPDVMVLYDLPISALILARRVEHAKDQFVDLAREANEQADDEMERWNQLLKVLPLGRHPHRNVDSGLTVHFSSKSPVTLKIHTYTPEKLKLYNIYPRCTSNEALSVKSIALHFRQRPKKKKLLDTLKQFPLLTNLEIYVVICSYLTTTYDVAWASNPCLQSLSARLSLIPYFLSGSHSISKQINSLRINCDQNSDRAFMTPEQWASTVETGGLGTGLQYLDLEGPISTADTTLHAVPLLAGLRNVVTLSLRGTFMTPIIDVVSGDSNVLPILRRLELRDTDIDESKIEKLVNSRGGSTQSGSVPIRELLLDHCSNITRDFCDRIRGGVENLTVYC